MAIDAFEGFRGQSAPFFAVLEGARDADGDGFIEVSVGVAASSRVRHTRMSAAYLLPEGTRVDDPEAVWSGAWNGRCLLRADAGATPEQGPQNQLYDTSDVGIGRLWLRYRCELRAGESRTWWLKVPPIHRREPSSMGYIAHAFRDVLPGEAVPAFGPEQVRALAALDPLRAEEATVRRWERFFSGAARIDVPDGVLQDIFLSRLATRAILDVSLGPDFAYNACSAFFYFDHAWRDHAYVVTALDLAGLHDRAERLLRAYCAEAKDVPPGPTAFDGKPLRLGMLESGLWQTRPGQYDTQGQNIWALVEHWRLTGDRGWLERTAYPYVRRGALWIVGSRRRHREEVKDPDDPRYGLIEPGGMEVLEVGKGMHMYYMNAFAVLGLREAAEAAAALGLRDDAKLFEAECADLKRSLRRSFERTFRRTGLYEGHLWFGVEPEGVGMYGFWAHNVLLWPCRALDPHDPMLTATIRRLERMASAWGGGLHSEGPGSFWPYIGADRAVGHLLRGEPDRALDYFCAFTDTAGGTLSWGEGYSNLTAGGDQPHQWADAQWIHLFRRLLVLEDGPGLHLTPATFRRWSGGARPIAVSRLPTHFGDLDMTVTPSGGGSALDYRIRVAPRGDQASRPLERLIEHPRAAGGRRILRAEVDGEPSRAFSGDAVVVPEPRRGAELRIRIEVEHEP
ncbi:MAG: hypothetical protein HY721_27925 [Planctomycetes bacterium]|nr:hypothetical protein [Planctomycetota bacterium]